MNGKDTTIHPQAMLHVRQNETNVIRDYVTVLHPASTITCSACLHGVTFFYWGHVSLHREHLSFSCAA